jgi:hypothetical protein
MFNKKVKNAIQNMYCIIGISDIIDNNQLRRQAAYVASHSANILSWNIFEF